MKVTYKGFSQRLALDGQSASKSGQEFEAVDAAVLPVIG